MNDLPAAIELIGQPYGVELVRDSHPELDVASADQRAVGTILMSSQRILLADDLAAGQLRDTLLHEALHGLVRAIGMFGKANEEERVVMGLAPLLLDMLRRNPSLVAYLVADRS